MHSWTRVSRSQVSCCPARMKMHAVEVAATEVVAHVRHESRRHAVDRDLHAADRDRSDLLGAFGDQGHENGPSFRSAIAPSTMSVPWTGRPCRADGGSVGVVSARTRSKASLAIAAANGARIPAAYASGEAVKYRCAWASRERHDVTGEHAGPPARSAAGGALGARASPRRDGNARK